MERLRSQETGIFKKKPADFMQIFKVWWVSMSSFADRPVRFSTNFLVLETSELLFPYYEFSYIILKKKPADFMQIFKVWWVSVSSFADRPVRFSTNFIVLEQCHVTSEHLFPYYELSYIILKKKPADFMQIFKVWWVSVSSFADRPVRFSPNFLVLEQCHITSEDLFPYYDFSYITC